MIRIDTKFRLYRIFHNMFYGRIVYEKCKFVTLKMNRVRKWYAKVVHYLIMTLNALQGSEKKLTRRHNYRDCVTPKCTSYLLTG